MTHASTATGPFAAPTNLIRLSVGIESADDLVADLEQGARGDARPRLTCARAGVGPALRGRDDPELRARRVGARARRPYGVSSAGWITVPPSSTIFSSAASASSTLK